MARKAGSKGRAVPKYRLHKTSGKAVVSINGKDFYLGKHGTTASHQRYKELIADKWYPPGSDPNPAISKLSDEVSVTKLAIEYAKYVKRKHAITRMSGIKCDWY